MSQELERRQVKDLRKGRKQLSKPRITPLEGEWDRIISREYEMLKRFPDTKILNIYKTMAKHPNLYKNWGVFTQYILTGSSLRKRDRELIILRIGWLCQSEYEWAQHAQLARNIGFSEEKIEGIAKGPDAEGWSDFEITLLHAVDELYINAFISDETWKALSEKYNDKKLMDLICTVGQYNLVSMYLNSLGIQLEEGVKGFPD
jgi:alkylhydroperoxidase family enzyme